MKHSYLIRGWNFSALCQAGMLWALLSPSVASAGDKPEKVEIQEGLPVAKKAGQQARADFFEAMKSIKSQDYDKAIELLNKVIAQEVNNPVPYINLALVYKKMGNLPLADENFRLAIKIEPENPVANNEYALLLRQTGKFSEARKIYENILEKQPNFIMAHRNLGILCDLYLRDYKCALQHYTIYSAAVPSDGTVKIWMADVAARQ